jgi:hypothetical protein
VFFVLQPGFNDARSRGVRFALRLFGKAAANLDLPLEGDRPMISMGRRLMRADFFAHPRLWLPS